MKINYKKLAISIAIPYIASFLGAAITKGAITDWYVFLNKPSFNPPNWIFGPVWTALYLLMGLSLYLIWTSKKNTTAIKWFTAQLALNAMWTPIFFGLKSPKLALLDIILLLIALTMTIITTNKISKKAAILLIPYLLWVSFATILNAAIVILNP